MVVGMYSTFFIGVLYFQHVLGYSPVLTGLAFLPQTLSVAVMSSGLTARIMRRLGPKDDGAHGPVGGGRRAHPDGQLRSRRRPTSRRSSRRCC